jgi:FAD/FMN-containing dehydrogenase
MSPIDRRELLTRGGRLAVAAGVVPWWRLARSFDASDPRLRELRRGFAGDVVGRGDSGYDRARVLFNPRFDGSRPLGVAFCETVADVQRAIVWSRRHGIRVAARSGGHSYGGYSTTPGLVVDVTRMDEVAVDASGSTAAIGAGARLIDVDAGLWRRRRAIPAGSCPTVGIAGLALGGGVGFSSRKLGTTSDNVVEVRIVDARGRLLVCSSREHDDLYWASRGGGGGNFGIVTSFRFRVHPVSRVTTFTIEWRWADAERVVAAWQQWAPHAPDELFSVCNLAVGTTGPRVRVVGQLFGTAARLDSLLTPLLGAAAPTRVARVERDYLSAAKMWAGCPGTIAECQLGQVRLREQAADKGRDPDARARGRGASGGTAKRERADGLIRRSDQPRAEARDRLRPSGRALLAAVLLGRLVGRDPPVAAATARGDAPVRLRLRVPELRRPGPRDVGARVLRRELSAAADGQATVRPRERLSLRAERPTPVRVYID